MKRPRLYGVGVLAMLAVLAGGCPGPDNIPAPLTSCFSGGPSGGTQPTTTVHQPENCTISLNPPGPDGVASYAAHSNLAEVAPAAWWIECILGHMIQTEQKRIDIPIIKMSGAANPKGQARKLIGFVLGPPPIFGGGVGYVKFWDTNAQDAAYFYRSDVEIELRHP